VLLDIMLPKRDGLSLLSQFRQQAPHVPVIMLTAKAEDEDKLRGLDLGADDYIIKPFNPREVLARVRAVLRRAQPHDDVPDRVLIRVGDLQLDESSLEVHFAHIPLTLTATEFRLLAHLAKYPGKVFSRLDLLEAALPERDALERVIDSHLKNVRRKLTNVGAGEMIETVYGVGYRLREVSREPH
jgi:two-component system response regulator AdeR